MENYPWRISDYKPPRDKIPTILPMFSRVPILLVNDPTSYHALFSDKFKMAAEKPEEMIRRLVRQLEVELKLLFFMFSWNTIFLIVKN